MNVPVALVLALILTPLGAPPVTACADEYNSMGFGPFPADAQTTPPVFYGADDQTTGSFMVRWTGLSCRTRMTMTAEYFDVPGSATEAAPADYQVAEGQRTPEVGSHETREATVSFPIVNDVNEEEVAELFTLGLRNPDGGGTIDAPLSVPFVLVDGDGGSRVGFDALRYSQSESGATLAVPVWRGGSAGGSATVPYTVGPGSSAGATSGEDYRVTSPNPLTFSAGDRVELITLAVVNDKMKEPQETVDIALQAPTGSALAATATTTVAIADNEESIEPQSRLHHPRQGRKYERGDVRLREIHVFTSDEGGSGVVRSELALRRNLKNGKCAWWTRKGWTAGDCDAARWVKLSTYEPDFFYYRLKALPPSVGGKVKSYTAFSRAVDGAGNVESGLVRGRNANTFEVTK